MNDQTAPDSGSRETLLVLLMRAERGALLEAERPLLRPLIEFELAKRAEAEAAIERVRAVADELKRHGCPWSGNEPGAADQVLKALDGPKTEA